MEKAWTRPKAPSFLLPEEDIHYRTRWQSEMNMMMTGLIKDSHLDAAIPMAPWDGGRGEPKTLSRRVTNDYALAMMVNGNWGK